MSDIVEWHGDEIFRRFENANRESLRKIALATEAQAKLNIEKPFEHASGEMRGQIDTGAMLNSTRAEFDGLPAGAEAAVVSEQEYAGYQEAIRAFLMPAAEQVADEQAPGIISSQWR